MNVRTVVLNTWRRRDINARRDWELYMKGCRGRVKCLRKRGSSKCYDIDEKMAAQNNKEKKMC